MIWYETQQSQCSWDHGDERRQSEPSGRDPRTETERERENPRTVRERERERERERQRESESVCVCVVYIFIMSMEQTEICIKKKKAEVLCEYWRGRILFEPPWRSGPWLSEPL